MWRVLSVRIGSKFILGYPGVSLACNLLRNQYFAAVEVRQSSKRGQMDVRLGMPFLLLAFFCPHAFFCCCF